MTKDQREIQRKLRILRYAAEIGHVAKTSRYFGIGRSSFYRWRPAYSIRGESGLINAPPIPKWHANRTPPEHEEKVLYLYRKYHLGPMRIVWYLARYHDIKISDATVSRIQRWHEMNRLQCRTLTCPPKIRMVDLSFVGRLGDRHIVHDAIDEAMVGASVRLSNAGSRWQTEDF